MIRSNPAIDRELEEEPEMWCHRHLQRRKLQGDPLRISPFCDCDGSVDWLIAVWRENQPIEWLGESPLSVDAVFSGLKKAANEVKGPSETEKAEAWFLEFMDGKPVKARDIEAAAEDTGIAFGTVKNAKQRLGIQSGRAGIHWIWLPVVDEEVA